MAEAGSFQFPNQLVAHCVNKHLSVHERHVLKIANPHWPLEPPQHAIISESTSQQWTHLAYLLSHAQLETHLRLTNGCPTWSGGLLALLRHTYFVYEQAFYNISVLDIAKQAISSGDFVELFKPYPELHEGSKFPDLCELRVSLYRCPQTCQNGLLSRLGFRLPATVRRVEVQFVGNWCTDCYLGILRAVSLTQHLRIRHCGVRMRTANVPGMFLTIEFPELVRIRTPLESVFVLKVLQGPGAQQRREMPRLQCVELVCDQFCHFTDYAERHARLFEGCQLNVSTPPDPWQMACRPCTPRLRLLLGQGKALFQTEEESSGNAAPDCPHIVGAEAVDVAASTGAVCPSFLHLHFPLLPHSAALPAGFNASGIQHLTLSTCFLSDYDVYRMEEDLEELCARSILPFLSSCFCPASDSDGEVALCALDISAELALGLCSALEKCPVDTRLATVKEVSIGNQTGLGIRGYRLPASLPPVRSLVRLLRLFPALTCLRLQCKRFIRCASMEEIMRSSGAHLQRLFVCTRFGGRFLPALPPNQISAPLLDVLVLYYGSPIIADAEKEGRENTNEKHNENEDGEEVEKDAEGEIMGPHNGGEHQDGGEKEDEGVRANKRARREVAESPVLPTGVRMRHLAIGLSKKKLPDEACLDQFFQSIPCLEWFVVIVHDDDKTLFWHRETAGPEAEENRLQKKLNETKTFIERTTSVLALNEAHPELFGVFWRELIDINVLSLS